MFGPQAKIGVITTGLGLAAAVLMSTAPAQAQSFQDKQAVAANITGAPPERKEWLKRWANLDRTGVPGPGTKAPVKDIHNYSGVWQIAHAVTYMQPDIGAREDGLAPFNALGEKIFNYRLKANAIGYPVAESSLYCRPFGLPRLVELPAPIQLAQEKDVLWHFYQDRVRPVYLNQEHPKNLKPSYMGHSVGKWDGNTLVIDTIGFNGKTTQIDHAASPQSDKLHMVERWTKAEDGASFDLVATFDDPVYYTRPFGVKLKYLWRPDLSLPDNHCEDNPRLTIYKGLMYNGEEPPREKDAKK